MTARDYLFQAHRLDAMINADIKEIEKLRELSTSISTSQKGERVQTSKKCVAPYVEIIEKIVDMEREVNDEIDLLVDLKREIRQAINTVKNDDERMVLYLKYLHNYTTPDIADEMYASDRTVRRWHQNGLEHIVIPEDPIRIFARDI